MLDSRKKVLLLVEDDAILALAEKKQLEKYGYDVVSVGTGEKAIEAIETNPNIGLILMDIDLGPGLDGTQAAELILKDHDIPIIFLSSYLEPEMLEKTEKIASYGYIVKSPSLYILDASIKMAFRLFYASKNSQTQKMELIEANNTMVLLNEDLRKSEGRLAKSESDVRNKLKAILEPSGPVAGLELSDIIDSKELQSLMEEFYKLTGILGAILDIKGNILVAAGWQDICTKFHRCKPISA